MAAYDQKELEQWKNGLLGKKSGGSNKKILLVVVIALIVVVAYLYLPKSVSTLIKKASLLFFYKV